MSNNTGLFGLYLLAQSFRAERQDAPDPPARAVCPECCEDHDYRYERNERGHYCIHCGQQAPEDWYDD